jgi:hypothetical protein
MRFFAAISRLDKPDARITRSKFTGFNAIDASF